MKKFILKSLICFSMFAILFLIACQESDEGNRPPVIVNQSFAIDEDAAISEVVGTVESIDQDGDIVIFSIVAGNEEGKFEINELSGEISIKALLDFEQTSSYVLTVQADDGQQTGEGSVTIDVNNIADTNNEVLTLLTSGTWNLVVNGARLNSQTQAEWETFTVTFIIANDGYGYTTTNSAYEAIWPSSGLFQFGESGREIIRSDDSELISIDEISESNLILKFTYQTPQARGAAIDGDWSFTFSR